MSDAGASPPRASETPRERLAYWTYRSAEALGAVTPDRIGRPLARIAGDLGARLLPGIRATVTENQARVLGVDPGAEVAGVAAREAFELYARYWYDTFRVRAIDHDEVVRRTTASGLEHIDAALEDGRGVICALPHMGNWDAAGRWLSALGYRIAAVAEVLRPPRLFELFLRHREELGMRIVPLAGGTGRRLGGLLADNWIVALVADRDLSGRGIEVEMFGARRRIPAGPALLSLSSGAPLLPCALYTTPDGWHVEISPPVDLPATGNRRADATAIANALACHFERMIAAHPADWHLFQPGWPA
ncbi:MAG: phosphatidylinositol mannoside acyltransferase [Actinomycetota bacterium]